MTSSNHFINALKFLQSNHDAFDVLIKIVGGLAVLPGAAYAVWQYVQAQKGPFRAQQMSFYFQSCDAAGVLSNYAKDSPEWAAAEKRFWVLYWGPMAVVEDLDVSRAMIEFGEELAQDSPGEVLREKSLALALACRSSVSTSWQLRLGRQAQRPRPESSPKDNYRK
jgi:hypothetical protein